MNFAKLLKECNQHYNHDIEHFYHPQKFLPSLGNHYSAVTIILRFHTSRIIQHVVLWVWLLSHCLMLFSPPQSKCFIDLLRCLQILKVTQPGLRTHSRGPEGARRPAECESGKTGQAAGGLVLSPCSSPSGCSLLCAPVPSRGREGEGWPASRLCITAWRHAVPEGLGWGDGGTHPQMDHSLSWGLS